MVVFSKITIALAGLASVTSAVPTGGAKKSFSFNQVAVPATKTQNFAGTYAHALAKYGAKVPTHVQAAASQSGAATNTPDNNDEEYLTPVNVGGTTLNLDFDTGSADL